MPELPEVETVRRGLAPAMEGKRIVSLTLNRADLRFPFPEDFRARVEGRTVTALGRRAKYLLASLEGGETIIMHLGMSGSFRIEGHEAPGAFHRPRDKSVAHDHVMFDLGDGRVVYNDPRRFGFMAMARTDSLGESPHLAKLGIEPLGPDFTPEALALLAAGAAAPLKAFLLDQGRIAGLGNIYVCEALHRAKLSPEAPAGALGKAAAKALAKAIRAVLEEAIEAGGSTLRDHRQADGALGYFQHRFAVYGREGLPCLRKGCGGVVLRKVQNGRSSFFCGMCQRGVV